MRRISPPWDEQAWIFGCADHRQFNMKPTVLSKVRFFSRDKSEELRYPSHRKLQWTPGTSLMPKFQKVESSLQHCALIWSGKNVSHGSTGETEVNYDRRRLPSIPERATDANSMTHFLQQQPYPDHSSITENKARLTKEGYEKEPIRNPTNFRH